MYAGLTAGWDLLGQGVGSASRATCLASSQQIPCISLESYSSPGLSGFGEAERWDECVGMLCACCWVVSPALRWRTWWEAILGENFQPCRVAFNPPCQQMGTWLREDEWWIHTPWKGHFPNVTSAESSSGHVASP